MLITTKPKIHTLDWPIPNVLAFTTTRQCITSKDTATSLISTQAYGDFNLGQHVGDDPIQVEYNRRTLQTTYLPSCQHIQWLNQVHQANVVEVNQYSEVPLVADAAITRVPYLALAVMTADCLPIILSDKHGREIAVIHGGWRPLAKDIIKCTVDKMHSKASDLYAWLGPCISPQAFEVGKEVREPFTATSNTTFSQKIRHSFSQAFRENPHKADHYFADLHLIAHVQLKELGVKNIERLPHCTYKQSEQYYSYRRSGTTGRMASVAMLTSRSA